MKPGLRFIHRATENFETTVLRDRSSGFLKRKMNLVRKMNMIKMFQKETKYAPIYRQKPSEHAHTASSIRLEGTNTWVAGMN